MFQISCGPFSFGSEIPMTRKARPEHNMAVAYFWSQKHQVVSATTQNHILSTKIILGRLVHSLVHPLVISQRLRPMGNTAFCGNCSELCLELVTEARCDQPEKELIRTIRCLGAERCCQMFFMFLFLFVLSILQTSPNHTKVSYLKP